MHRKYFMLAALPMIGAALIASLHVISQVAAEERFRDLKSQPVATAQPLENSTQPERVLLPWRQESSSERDFPFPTNGWAALQANVERAAAEQAALTSAPVYTISTWESQVTGMTTPNVVITAEVKRAGATVGYGVGRADAIGAISSFGFYAAGKSVPVQSGDSVVIHAGASVSTTAIPALTAVYTPSNGILGGRLTGVSNPVSLTLHIFDKNQVFSTDGNGYFSVNVHNLFVAGQEILPWVIYRTPNGNQVIWEVPARNGMTALIAARAVEGYATPGANVAYLAKGSGGGTKSVGAATADARSGYWSFGYDTFSAGDSISVSFNGGAAVIMSVAPLSLTFDVATDLISGHGPANITLTLYVWHVSGGTMVPQQVSAKTNGSGNFQVTSPINLNRYDCPVSIMYLDSRGNETASWYNPPSMNVSQTYSIVWGYTKPDSNLNIRYSHAGNIYARDTTSDKTGYYELQFTDTPHIDTGDIVTVTGNGPDMMVQLKSIHLAGDLSADTLSGEIVPAAPDVALQYDTAWDVGYGAMKYQGVSSATAGSQISINLAGLYDMRNGDRIHLYYAQEDGNRVYSNLRTPYIDVNLGGSGVFGYVMLNGPVTSIPATITLSNKAEVTATIDHDGWFGNDSLLSGIAQIEPGDIVTVTTSNWQQSVYVQPITIHVDPVLDRVTGNAPANKLLDVLVISRDGSQRSNVNVPSSPTGDYLVDMSGIQDIVPGSNIYVGYLDENGNEVFSKLELPYAYARVNQTHNWVDGNATAGSTITITLRRAGVVLDTQTRIVNGGYNVGYGGSTSIQPGDVVELQSSTGITASIDVIPMSGTVDPVFNEIHGHLYNVNCPANVRGELWSNNGASQEAVSQANCDYKVHFSSSDVLAGDNVALWYVRPDGNEVGIVRSALRIMVDLDDSRVNGNTLPQAPVYVTVTGSPQKAAETTVTDMNGNYNFQLYSAAIDANDVVTVSSGGNTYATQVPVTLTASMDDAADTISGYGPPNATLYIDVNDRPVGGASVTINGAGFYSLNTNTLPWNYDLQPYDMGQVYTLDANGEQSLVHFGAVHINTYINANGQAAPGGRYEYELHYQANSAPARDVVLTDTLPAGASLVSVSNGYPHYTIGNQVVISAGLAHQDQDYYVRLVVAFDGTLSPGTQVTNTVAVGADAYNQNTDGSIATHVMNLETNNTDLKVWKDPLTGDPVAGQAMIWRIGYNNSGSTGSGVVRITDTLPVSTTFVRWWSEELGWTLVQSGTQVVFERDTVRGNQGSWIYLVLQLNPALTVDKELHNTVDSYTPNDIDLNNNSDSRNVYVSTSRQDLKVSKSFDSGSFTPGGVIYYGLNYSNNGNVAIQHVLLTDTLPAGVTFIRSGYGTEHGWVSVPYSYTVGNQYVWDLGAQVPGAFGNFQVVVQVNPTVTPGTVLTNSAVIGGANAETWPFDNTSTVTVVARPSGPNLRVYKEANWNGTGQIEYTLHVENIGDTSVNNVIVTDTYPLHTSFSNWWMQWWPGKASVSEDVSAQRAVFTLSQIEAGNTAGIRLQLNVDGPYVNQPGLLFTNTITATSLQSDVNPSDNAYRSVVTSGADLYAVNHIASGKPGPGKVITYLLEYGNRSDMSDAAGSITQLVDQLPAGMQYVSANPAPTNVWGNSLQWINGRMGSGWRSVIELSVRITTTAKPGEIFTTTLSINDSSPATNEPYYDNNTSTATVQIDCKRVFVPVVRR